MSLTEVSKSLWRERNLLELLLFKLEQEQLVVSSGLSRWLHQATREVELVLQEIQHAQLARAVEVDGLAYELGLEPGETLASLCTAVPEPWDAIFDNHRQAFLAASREIQALAESNRDLLDGTRRGGLVETARAHPRRAPERGTDRPAGLGLVPTVIDRQLEEVAYSGAAAARVVQPSLVDFIG